MTRNAHSHDPSTPRRGRRRTTIWSNTLATIVVVTLTACNDNDGADSAAATVPVTASPAATNDDAPSDNSSNNGEAPSTIASTSITSPPVTPSTTQPEALIDIINQPGNGEFEGALADADVLECATTAGRWSATGTVTNPTNTTVDYRIYVSFLDTAGETLALIETDIDELDPASTADWSAGFPSEASDLRCVLRVERRQH